MCGSALTASPPTPATFPCLETSHTFSCLLCYLSKEPWWACTQYPYNGHLPELADYEKWEEGAGKRTQGRAFKQSVKFPISVSHLLERKQSLRACLVLDSTQIPGDVDAQLTQEGRVPLQRPSKDREGARCGGPSRVSSRRAKRDLDPQGNRLCPRFSFQRRPSGLCRGEWGPGRLLGVRPPAFTLTVTGACCTQF